MALRFYINDANGQLSFSPLGGAVGEESSPLLIYRCNLDLEWQWGAADQNGIYRPQRKPDDTAIDFGFLVKGAFEGDWVISIDAAHIDRPTAGTGTGYVTNFSAGFAVNARLITLGTGSGTILAGDYVAIGANSYLVQTGISSPGNILLAQPGLVEIVPDGVPVTVLTEAGFYTATFNGDTAAGRALLNTPNGDPADDIKSKDMNGQMTWIYPDADPDDPPLGTGLIYATYLNAFAVSGASPSAVNAEWIIVTGPATAMSRQQIIPDTTAGAITLTLPATPSVGDAVTVWDGYASFATHAVTLNRNGQLIGGAPSNLVIGTSGYFAIFVFMGGSIGWNAAPLIA